MRICAILILIVLLTSCASKDNKAIDTLFVPDDLEATLWAESPLFYNPTNMDIDSKGRVWITEAVNYRNFNNDSLKHLHHQMGDRVMILEDTNGDGQADQSKVFVQDKDLVSPLGVAVIGNQVFVSCSPNLIVYTDENGDDVPDKKEIFLTGFGGLDHDHALHCIVGGPDGSLYFNTGNAGPHTVTDKNGWTLRSGSIYTGGTPYNRVNQGNRRSDDGKVWVGGLALKIEPDGKQLKVVGHNFRNAYELFIDARGDMWQNDNDDQVVTCRVTWLMEGGNVGYFSTDGTRYWSADQRPGQDIFTAHWHQDDPGTIPAGDRTGAGAPTGIVLNESDALGEKYRGMLMSADAGRNVIFSYQPKLSQSGYDLGKRQNLITSLQVDNENYIWNDSAQTAGQDKWFRPSDVSIGTDGAIYVADWYDPVVGGHDMKDSLGYGRIYRLTPKGKKLSRPTVDLTTLEGLLEAVKNPAVNVRYEAAEKLTDMGAAAIPGLKKMLISANPFHKARAIWILAAIGPEGIQEVESLLSDPEESARIVAFRALRRFSSDLLPIVQRMAADPSAFVRREVIIAITAFPYEVSKPVLVDLLKGFQAKDRWYLEALGAAVAGHESDFMKSVSSTLNAENKGPEEWSGEMEAMAWRLHPPEYVLPLSFRARSSKLSLEARIRSITALAFINDKAAVSAMLSLTKDPNKEISELATYWLAFRQSNDWYSLADWKKLNFDPAHERMVADMKVRMSKIMDEKMPPDEKKWNAREMAKSDIGSVMILSKIQENKFPTELFPEVKALLLESSNLSVRVQASMYFSTGATKFSIPAITSLQADAIKGKTLFSSQCANCHAVGNSGKTIGPELTAINKKFDKAGLIDAIVNPSAGVVFGYEAWTIQTKDGQSQFGFLVADGKDVVVIKDLLGVQHPIQVSEIKSRTKSDKSLMPQPADLGFTEQDVADVVRFLTEVK